MDRSPAEGGVTIPPFERRGVSYAIAGPGDDADVRRILRDVPMDGWVRVSLTREPEMGLAHRALGQSGCFVILRDAATTEAICIGEYHTSTLFMNGRPTTVPYIGALRVVPEWRGQLSLLREGLGLVRRFQQARGEPPFMLTSIAAENAPATRLLEANLAGMPDYHPVGRMVTLVLPTSRRRQGSAVRAAGEGDMPAIAAALQAAGGQGQFMPEWDEAALAELQAQGGLQPDDFRLVERAGAIVGSLAAWDQRSFRQVQVHGYAPWLSRMRPVYNLLAGARGRPYLPPPGDALRQVVLSHFLVPPDPWDAVALVADTLSLARSKGADSALLGLDARHHLVATLRRRFGALSYETKLYIVSWKSGPPPPVLDRNLMLCPEIAVL